MHLFSTEDTGSVKDHPQVIRDPLGLKSGDYTETFAADRPYPAIVADWAVTSTPKVAANCLFVRNTEQHHRVFCRSPASRIMRNQLTNMNLIS